MALRAGHHLYQDEPLPGDKQYSKSVLVPLRRPSADTGEIVQAALMGLRQIYRTGYKLAKAGVMLADLCEACRVPPELDLGEPSSQDRAKLMGAVDLLNRRYGRGAAVMGSSGTGDLPRNWAMKQERRTPRYTTKLDEIPVGKA